MIRTRLFAKVYLTLLASLLAVALASGAYWRLMADNDSLGWIERRDRLVGAILPGMDEPHQVQAAIERLGRALGAPVSLYDPAGRLVASTREILPLETDNRPLRPDPGVMRLPDGRVLITGQEPPWQVGGAAPGYLVLIALVVGLAGYPVVRHLTRRLEELRDGVERFGAGSLGTRVRVNGRDEIAAVASSFNQAARRIEELVAAHRTLLANASHELRSPLTRLRMAVDLSAPDRDDATGREIIESLDEIDLLVDEILLASRLQHVGSTVRLEPLDLTALAAEECARHGLEVSGEPVQVRGDVRLLMRLVRNLVANAARHGQPPIGVHVGRDGVNAMLAVSDHGTGLPAGEEDRVFEPFYRPPGRSEAAGGWGLGLALVKQIAELHGGRVRYERPAEAGARFVVDLPLAGSKSSDAQDED